LSAQHQNISHLNAPTRKMTKWIPLEDKEAYLREGSLVAKKCHNIVVCPKRSIEASLSKPNCPI
jgi:hypothetical protein